MLANEKLALYGVSVNACIPGSNVKTELYRYAKGVRFRYPYQPLPEAS